tara:strand:+ start:32 stop:322 length:291 start_codon:yes stop_codon:yes gene_type:complete
MHEIDLDSIEVSTEQRYLELADNFKDVIEEKDREVDKLKKSLMNYKFIFAKVFGNIAMVEDVMAQIDFGENILQAVIRHTLDYILSDLKNLYEIEI